MTREEAKREIKKVFVPAFANYIITALTEGATVSDKALKQEPCEDAVSRQAVDNLAWEYLTKATDENIAFYEHFLDLPSITPQKPKIGYWTKHNTPNGKCYYDCSLCGCVAPRTETADSYLWKLSNFCPDCGAKMNKEEKEV